MTIVVAAFMLGLGLGSLAGGALSRDARRPLLVVFASIETALGLFGFVSLKLFHFVGRATAAGSGLTTFLSTFALVLVPTVLMGATLPILVAHSVRQIRNVGQSVGMLYFVNTLGSALAGFTTAAYLLGILGQQRTVAVAASLNLLVGASVFLASRRRFGAYA